MNETWQKCYLLICTSSAGAGIGGLAAGREAGARWKLPMGDCYFWKLIIQGTRANYSNCSWSQDSSSHHKARCAPKYSWAAGKKITSLYWKHQRPNFYQLCRCTHIHEKNYKGSLHVRYEKGDMSYVVIYHVCTTVGGQATDWCMLLSTVTAFPLQTVSLRCFYYVSTSSSSLPLSRSVLQRWRCSSRVTDAAVHSTQTKPKRFAMRLFRLSTCRKQNAIWTAPASMQQNLHCSENGQQQDDALWSTCTHSQPKNTFGKLQVFFLPCKPMRNKGQKHSTAT